ncbi:MAG TPA: hypothetical protein VKA03_05705, partial [Methylovirgula sp.]|nr:hypothetical protein [Methylovirgula sp.]
CVLQSRKSGLPRMHGLRGLRKLHLVTNQDEIARTDPNRDLSVAQEDAIEKVVDERLDELAEEIAAQKLDFAPLPPLTLNTKGPYAAKSGPAPRANGAQR